MLATFIVTVGPDTVTGSSAGSYVPACWSGPFDPVTVTSPNAPVTVKWRTAGAEFGSSLWS